MRDWEVYERMNLLAKISLEQELGGFGIHVCRICFRSDLCSEMMFILFSSFAGQVLTLQDELSTQDVANLVSPSALSSKTSPAVSI